MARKNLEKNKGRKLGGNRAGIGALADKRRFQIAEMALQGLSERQIGSVLGIAGPTVHRHIEKAREEWRAAAADAIGEVTATLIAQHKQAYRKLLADYEASKLPQVTVREEYEIPLIKADKVAHRCAATESVENSIEAQVTRELPKSVHIVRTTTPGSPAIGLIVEAGSRLDAIAKLYGAYKPTKTAATTPDGSQPALPTTQVTNYNYLDFSKLDPDSLTAEEQDVLCKVLAMPQLLVTGSQIVEGQTSPNAPTTCESGSTPSGRGDSSSS